VASYNLYETRIRESLFIPDLHGPPIGAKTMPTPKSAFLKEFRHFAGFLISD
jgi:hypothetical protein